MDQSAERTTDVDGRMCTSWANGQTEGHAAGGTPVSTITVKDGRDMDHDAADAAAVVAHLDLRDAIHVGHSTGGGDALRRAPRPGPCRQAGPHRRRAADHERPVLPGRGARVNLDQLCVKHHPHARHRRCSAGEFRCCPSPASRRSTRTTSGSASCRSRSTASSVSAGSTGSAPGCWTSGIETPRDPWARVWPPAWA
jgi:hypothetical protein